MADATTLSVLITARDQASAAFQKIEGNMGRMAAGFQKHRKTIGVAATAIGGLITGIAAMSVKSSLDQQIGIRQLDGVMKNIGTSYAANKQQIEELVAAQQNKTNFGDEEQRKALRSLIGITGSYDKAMAAMIPTMDFAAEKEMDLSTAATLVARAISGEETALGRYGITVEKGAGATAVLTAITTKYSGAAEDAADPTKQLSNRIGDLFQAIGNVLLPMLEVLVPQVDKMVNGMTAWAEAHPGLTKVLVIVATAVGGVLLVVGPLLLLLPTIVAAIGLVSVAFVKLNLSMGVITLIVIAISVAIAAAIIIWMNWEKWSYKVKAAIVAVSLVLAAFLGPIALIPIAIMAIIAVIKNWDKIWIAIRKTTEVVVNAIIKFINDLGKSFAGVFKMISGVLDKLPGPLKNLIPGFEELQGALADVTATLEDGIQPMDIYNERQEMIKHLQEGLAESAKERADAEEKSAERSVTAMGEVTGAVVAGVDEQMAKQDEQIAKQKEVAESDKYWTQVRLDARVAETEAAQTATEAFAQQMRDITEADRISRISREQSLEDLRFSLDETTVKWEESGATVETVVKNWASQMGISTDDVINRLGDMKIDVKDWSAVLKGAISETGRSFDVMTASVDLATAAAKALNLVPPYTGGLSKEEYFALGEVKRAEAALAGKADPAVVAAAVAAVPTELISEFGNVLSEKARIPAGAHPVEVAALERHHAQRLEEAQDRVDKAKQAAAKKVQESVDKAKADLEAAKEAVDKANAVVKAKATAASIQSAIFADDFAHGGRSSGGLALVGERGPELVSLPRGAFVHPTGTGPSSGGGVTLIFNGDVYGVDDLREVVVEAVRDHAISGGFAGVFGEP